MKIYIHIICLIVLICSKLSYGQVGINTQTPSAALEVVSEKINKTGKLLKATNENNLSMAEVSTSGDLKISKALMPAGDPGTVGTYLISQGADAPPVWRDLPKGATIQIFNAQRDANMTTTNLPGGNYTIITFNIINSSTDANYGSWNGVNNAFTVAKKGIYTITAGFTSYDIQYGLGGVGPSGDWELYSVGIYLMINGNPVAANIPATIEYNSKYSGYITQSLILNDGDRIQIGGQSNMVKWKQGPSFISVLYSEIP